MSRIILTRYEDGQERVVVGWDHPAGGAFWQEFSREPEDGDYEKAMDEGWQEVLRDGGMMPGIPLPAFRESVPEDLRPLITHEVISLLGQHSRDPDSGSRSGLVDLTRR